MYGDTEVVRALARQVRERGDDIRAESDDLLRHVEGSGWTGLAAEAMRRLAREHAGGLRSCAEAHDEAAAALERHAREVDHVRALIAAVERRVHRLIDAATSGLAGLVGHLAPDGLDRWLHDFDPPPHGSPEWLDVRLPRSA